MDTIPKPILLSIALLAGCAGNKAVSVESPTNAHCPMCEKAVDPSCCTPFDGCTVAFCTANCCSEWQKLPQAERNTRLDRIRRPRR